MTENVTSTEFELVVRGQAELREDFKKMAEEHRSDMRSISASQADLSNSQVDLNGKFSRFLDITDNINEDVQEIKKTLHDPEDGVSVRLRRVETKQAVAQETNRDRWKILGAAILGFISISAIVVTIVLWALEQFAKVMGGP